MACCGSIRTKCFIIGYMNLVACVVDIIFHLLVAGIVSNWFQCDVTTESIKSVDWPWLEPFLLFINIGTHSFYPFPMIVRNGRLQMDCLPAAIPPRCYPGMLHIYLTDILNLLINLIWLKFVVSYIKALHQKDPEPMRMFFHLSGVKLAVQILYFAYQPSLYNNYTVETFWILKLVDIAIAMLFLFFIKNYINFLKNEKPCTAAVAGEVVELPPSYVECLIGSPRPVESAEKKTEENPSIHVIRRDDPATLILEPSTGVQH